MYGTTTPREGEEADEMQLLDTDAAASSSAVHPVSPSAIAGHHSATDSFSSSEKRGFYSPLHYESIDFDPFENQVFMKEKLERHNSDDGDTKQDWYERVNLLIVYFFDFVRLGKSDKVRAAKRWMIISMVGIGTALVASFIRSWCLRTTVWCFILLCFELN